MDDFKNAVAELIRLFESIQRAPTDTLSQPHAEAASSIGRLNLLSVDMVGATFIARLTHQLTVHLKLMAVPQTRSEHSAMAAGVLKMLANLADG